MKNKLWSLIQKAAAPVALAAALAAFTPVAGMAEEHRGGEFSRGFRERGEVRRDFDRHENRREYRDRDFDRDRYRDRDFHRDYDRGRVYERGYGFGVGVYPGYAPVCSPAGFYDRFGVWHFYPGCAY